MAKKPTKKELEDQNADTTKSAEIETISENKEVMEQGSDNNTDFDTSGSTNEGSITSHEEDEADIDDKSPRGVTNDEDEDEDDSVTDDLSDYDYAESKAAHVAAVITEYPSTRYLPVLDSASSGLVIGFIEFEEEAEFVHKTRVGMIGSDVTATLLNDKNVPMGSLQLGTVRGVSTVVLVPVVPSHGQALGSCENFTRVESSEANSDYRCNDLIKLPSLVKNGFTHTLYKYH